jgi:hypothetical protein
MTCFEPGSILGRFEDATEASSLRHSSRLLTSRQLLDIDSAFESIRKPNQGEKAASIP